jgi:hypothetical protein
MMNRSIFKTPGAIFPVAFEAEITFKRRYIADNRNAPQAPAFTMSIINFAFTWMEGVVVHKRGSDWTADFYFYISGDLSKAG